MKTSKAELLAEVEQLRAAAALVPRRTQRMCSNCGAKSVRVDWLSCCWNPVGNPLSGLANGGGA